MKDDLLNGKSEKEIRRAATFWFMAAEIFQRGDEVPRSVFALSTEETTFADIEWARQFITEHPEWNEIQTGQPAS